MGNPVDEFFNQLADEIDDFVSGKVFDAPKVETPAIDTKETDNGKETASRRKPDGTFLPRSKPVDTTSDTGGVEGTEGGDKETPELKAVEKK